MDEDDHLDLLASLLVENEAEDSAGNERAAEDQDEYDLLFEAEDDESYTEEVEAEEAGSACNQENVVELFGDVADLSEDEEKKENVQKVSHPVALDQGKEHSNEDLQEELRKLQEQMKKLQEQLRMTVIGKPADSDPCKKTSGKSTAAVIKERTLSKVQECPSFSAQLNCPVLPLSKSHCPKPKPTIA
ncbi:protein MCM10 homolog, partial [Python bivittatus]|uniref:Protein MCM10 homolog n=1 Tax=Python bivittatus TaxID=176946 RepID=A0A9F2RB19_PYTBI